MKSIQIIILVLIVLFQFNQILTKPINDEIPLQYYDVDDLENVIKQNHQKFDEFYYDPGFFKNIQKKPSWTLTRFTKSRL